MKKILYTSLLFAGISAIFGLCYYLSFKNALLHYNREAVEQNTKLLNEILQSSGENERLLQQMLNENAEAVQAASTQETLRATASYFLETCYLQSQTEEREQLAIPGFMVGLSRRELTAYVEGYLESMPINEYLNGLISYEIVSFSEDKVVLRKTYDETRVEYQFYICRRGDFIVVYYSDLKTVYEYTEIRLSGLTEENQQAVEQGFYVKDTQELYSILEGYTS
ncbi:MAG: hypothetical protein IJ274_03985 [Lachnospiraceae bacterium]|nr:hypothetical protein [Lachnospiraceae bacterium]